VAEDTAEVEVAAEATAKVEAIHVDAAFTDMPSQELDLDSSPAF
jgi:hypothetical protein